MRNNSLLMAIVSFILAMFAAAGCNTTEPEPEQINDSATQTTSTRSGAEPQAKDWQIQFRVLLSDGTITTMTEQMGAMSRIYRSDGSTLGIMPQVKKDATISFQIFAVTTDSGGEETATLKNTLSAEMSVPVSTVSTQLESMVKIELIGIVESNGRDSDNFVDHCCVTCDGVTACGRAVEQSCGSCCTGTSC